MLRTGAGRPRPARRAGVSVLADLAHILARFTEGFRRLREESREALWHRVTGARGALVAHAIAFVFLGPVALLATLAIHAAVVAWGLGEGAVPAPPEPAGRPSSSSPFASAAAARQAATPSKITLPGVPAMPRFLKFLLSLVAAGLLLWLVSPFAIVPAGHRGVVTTFGKVSPVVFDEGIHLVIPVAQAVHLIDVRIQKGEGAGDAASKDLQQVHTTVALNYHIDPKETASVFQDVGITIGDKIIVPAVQEAVKAATAQYTAEELIAKRPEVRDRIRGLLVERLSRHGVIVDEFSIVNFAFSKSFNEAIEAKTTAEQLKLKAERDLQRIRVEAEQKVTQAKAEAESLALQKQQVTPELIRLREIENQRRAIEKWDGHMPQVAGGALPFINVQPAR